VPEAAAPAALGLRLLGDLPARVIGEGRPAPRRAVAVRHVADGLAPPDPASRRLGATWDDRGEPFLTVDRTPEGALRLAAPGYGAQEVAPDGRTITVAPAPEHAWRTARLLLAQVLPAAAVLQGLEVLHAGGIVLDGRAVAISAPSGTGKSSLIAHLAVGGAGFLSDDALALDPAAADLSAYPGPALLVLAPSQLATLPAEHFGPPLAATEDEVLLTPAPAPAPVPLADLCFVRRGGPGSAVEVERLRPVDPRLLLTATLAGHVTGRARTETLLAACSRIAETVACHAVRIPDGITAAEAAGVLAERLRRA
jgi:hypothetical protein